MRYGLDDTTVEKIKYVLSAFPQIESAVLYGSRAKGVHKAGSDIDLTLTGENLILSTMNQIGLMLDDLLLPYIFDLSVFSHIKNNDLREHINRVGIELYRKTREMPTLS